MSKRSGASKEAADFSATFARVCEIVDELKPDWHGHQEKGLEIRYRTGQALNGILGPPDQRLAYGQQVFEKVAEELHISRPELSWMRRFAFEFESLEVLGCQHPDCVYWAQVKEVLKQIRRRQRPKVKAEPRESHKVIRTLIKSVSAAAEAAKLLTSEGFTAEEEQRQQIRESLAELARALRNTGVDLLDTAFADELEVLSVAG